MWYIIVNPEAGNGKAREKWAAIEELLHKHNLAFEVVFTEYATHGILLAQQAVENGFTNIIAVGGDGTNNEIVNGIFNQSQIPTTEITLGVIPIGTGNDWIRTHNIPNDIEDAIRVIKECKTIFHDVGLVKYYRENKASQRYFINVAGMAYDAYIARLTTLHRGSLRNQFSYLWFILKQLFKYTLTKAKIEFDGKVEESKFYTINIGICKYSGGGMQFVPHAIPDDGLFALSYAFPIPKLIVVLLTPRFYNGSLINYHKVRYCQVKSVKVSAVEENPTLLEVDGEYLGETPTEFIMFEKSLKVIIPK